MGAVERNRIKTEVWEVQKKAEHSWICPLHLTEDFKISQL